MPNKIKTLYSTISVLLLTAVYSLASEEITTVDEVNITRKKVKPGYSYIISEETDKYYAYENIPQWVVVKETPNGERRSVLRNTSCPENEAVFKTTHKYLDLSNENRDRIPHEYYGLKGLNISYNNFMSLSHGLYDEPTIFRFKNLKILDISHNPLSDIPFGCEALESLQWLDISNTRLDSFPESILAIVSLKYLIANNNGYQKIPGNISVLSNLKQLSLEGNNIVNVPTTLKDIENLEELNLQYNLFCDFPDTLNDCLNLKVLRINGENINVENVDIKRLSKLKKLNISDTRETLVEDIEDSERGYISSQLGTRAFLDYRNKNGAAIRILKKNKRNGNLSQIKVI